MVEKNNNNETNIIQEANEVKELLKETEKLIDEHITARKKFIETFKEILDMWARATAREIYDESNYRVLLYIERGGRFDNYYYIKRGEDKLYVIPHVFWKDGFFDYGESVEPDYEDYEVLIGVFTKMKEVIRNFNEKLSKKTQELRQKKKEVRENEK